jgi:acetoin:2,6-dichlorophenolindophenol oxidoreductase subunit beta
VHTVSYLDAVVEAQHEEMARNSDVFVMGEDVSWNLQGTTRGLRDAFGVERVRDTPIAEAGFVGAGAGAAMVGMRPIVEVLLASFIYPAFDQLVSIIAKSTYLYGGQASLPLTIRMPLLYGIGNAAQHSDRPWSTVMTVPGLKIAVPSTASDVKGLLKTAIRTNDPVLVFEDGNCWSSREEVPDHDDHTIPLGVAAVRREGTDVTIVALAGAVRHALAAAEELAGHGVSAEVIDPRTIVPLDRDTILASVRKTGRLVAVDPAHEMGSFASEICAMVAQEAFWDLQAPVQRVTTPHTHIPYNKSLEAPLYPNADRVVAAVRSTME